MPQPLPSELAGPGKEPLVEQLEVLLQRRLGNRIRNLSVLVLPQGIILRGRTNTYHAKQVAQHAVMELSSLPLLANDIEVC
jgi:hypothetical protein